MGSDIWKRNKVLILEGFILINFVFLILDIYLAHSVNRFRHWGEWIPFGFSIVAALLLAASLRAGYKNQQSLFFRWAGQALGYCSIAVGIIGLIFHLEASFSRSGRSPASSTQLPLSPRWLIQGSAFCC